MIECKQMPCFWLGRLVDQTRIGPLAGQLKINYKEDYLPGAFSGAAFGYGLARDLSTARPLPNAALLTAAGR